MQPSVPSIEAIEKRWDEFAPVYSVFDAGPQAFFFTLINLLKIHKAKNILEIGCGTGHLLPYALNKKLQSTPYHATDLSKQMIDMTHKGLRAAFGKYHSSLTYEQWLAQNNLHLKAINGEQPIPGGPFDTVICNLVLMLTADPKKMLRSILETTTPEARLGITIWGRREENNFITLVGKAIKTLGLQVPPDRSPFYLYEIIDDVVKQCGWETELTWEQKVAFPLTVPDDFEGYIDTQNQMLRANYPEAQQEQIKAKARQMFREILEKKQAFIMSNKMMILKKKDDKSK